MFVRFGHRVIFWIFALISLLVGAWGQASSWNQPHLIINEVVSAAPVGLQDEDGHLSDWIEIYNPTNRPINLANWALTDDPTRPKRWSFPDITLAANHYLVVFASGKNRAQANRPLHTNFQIDKSGEFLALFYQLDNRLFPLEYSPPPPNYGAVSYGRYQDNNQYGYFETPTPGQPNQATPTWFGVVSPVIVSQPRGFYEQPVQVQLSTNTPNATIRYTLDGSQPTEIHGHIYQAPITLTKTTPLRFFATSPNFFPAAVETHTYLFIEQILSQPANPVGFPSNWGTHLKNRKAYGVAAGDLVMADYEMDPTLSQAEPYRGLIETGLRAIPTLSLVTDKANLDIYANPLERGLAWERPVSVEFMPTGRDQPEFQIDAGIRIQGNIGRQPYMPKHSFRLFFRGQYGQAKLNYPLFSNASTAEFNTLILRGGVNQSYAGYIDPKASDDAFRQVTYTRDEWLRASQIAMSGIGAHGTFVHLYLNGLYWGLYNLVERPDSAFSATYLSGEKEDWYAVNHSGPISGSPDRFEALHNLVSEGGAILQTPQTYAQVETYLNTIQFSDYIILNWYAGTEDWGHNNWYAGVQNPAGKVHYYVWDGERSWDDGAKLNLGADTASDGSPNQIKPLFWTLMWNVDFKMQFADRIYKHLFNDGALTVTNAQHRWRQINQPLTAAIAAESARWGDARYETPITQADWLQAQTQVANQMAQNVDKFIGLMRKQGLYPDIDPPTFNQHGGLIPPGFAVTLNAPIGDIYYTLDGSDPRLKGTGNLPPNTPVYWTGQPAPSAQLYQAPLILAENIQLKARIRQGEIWSALTEATFTVSKADSGLRLTELMYNPLGNKEAEFIELTNTSNTPVDIALISFEGISYTFPANRNPLATQETIVLVRNAAAFTARYPNIPIEGVYDGQLSNRGETITLVNPDGTPLLTVTYDDENGWPLSPDGRGDSLRLNNKNGNPNQPTTWRASTTLHGTPGIHRQN